MGFWRAFTLQKKIRKKSNLKDLSYLLLHSSLKRAMFIAKSILHKKEHSRRHHPTGLQTILQGYSNQIQRYRPMEQNRGIGGSTTYLQPYNL